MSDGAVYVTLLLKRSPREIFEKNEQDGLGKPPHGDVVDVQHDYILSANRECTGICDK
jgi:hypothetical protein